MSKINLAVGFLSIVFGLLIAGFALWTLKLIHKQKSLRYLRVMTLTILALSIALIFAGTIEVSYILTDRSNPFQHDLFIAVNAFIQKSGNFTVIWLVQFKYWETVR